MTGQKNTGKKVICIDLKQLMRKAFEVGVTFLHRLCRCPFLFHEQHHHNVREQEEGLLRALKAHLGLNSLNLDRKRGGS